MLDLRRRQFITLLRGAAAGWPLAARAQQPGAMPRIGLLSVFAESDPEGQALIRELIQRLQGLGWTNGRNVQVEFRFAGEDAARISTLASELIELRPDVVVASGALAATALRQQTSLHTDRFCASCRPGLCRLRHQPGTAGGQYHRLHEF